MRVSIFTDYTAKIGQGHLSRCAAMADYLSEQGHEVLLYVEAEDVEHVQQMAASSHYRLEFIHWKKRVNKVLSLTLGSGLSILDSYAIGQEMVEALEMTQRQWLFVDDYHHLRYRSAWAVDWSVGAEERVPEHWKLSPRCLTGLQYAVLRRPFCEPHELPQVKAIESVLMLLGGTDMRDLLPPLSRAVAQRFPHIRFTAVTPMAEFMPPSDSVRFVDVMHPQALREAMRAADLVVCGCGQTVLELVALQRPCIPIVVVDNQREDLEAWRKTGFVPFGHVWDEPDLKARLGDSIDYMESIPIRESIVKAMGDVQLREGAKRLFERMGVCD